MTGGVRYMMIITDAQRDWIKETAKATSLKGSDVVREAIERVMEDKDFKRSLANAQLKIKLQEINDKKATLAEEERKLKQHMATADRVLA